jgi:2-phosphosulfolactate phosphatase
MERIIFGQGVQAATNATGATVVIDTFRAFTTAAVLLASGIEALYLVSELDEARTLANRVGALLCGEDQGRRPDGFDLSNSPYEVSERADLGGAIIVQRTSAGTRSVIAAIDAGATPVYAASLVVAGATARAVRGHDTITVISSGLHGSEPAIEDDLTALHIAHTITHNTPPPDIEELVRTSDRAIELAESDWAHPDDVTIAASIDRYSFAMQALKSEDGLVHLTATRQLTTENWTQATD